MDFGLEFLPAAEEEQPCSYEPPPTREARSWAETLQGTVGLLGQVREADIGGPIQVVARRIGAESGLVAELNASGETTVIAAVGVAALSTAQLARAVAEVGEYEQGPRGGEPSSMYFLGSEGVGVVIAFIQQPDLPLLFALFVGRGLRSPDLSSRGALSLFIELLNCFRPGSPALTRQGRGRKLGGLVLPPGAIVLDSAPMLRVYDELAAISKSDLPVLLTGETGVGKEHLARALHLSSNRASGPFVAVNCAALPAELLEAELFGIARGVATGVNARGGRFLAATGGTLFLDEVSELSAALQPKLLRAIQEREVVPLGGSAIAADFRLVSASNVAVEELLKGHCLRSDLYYRLAGCRVNVPPLRERTEDIPTLIRHIVFQASGEKRVRGISAGAYRAVLEYAWPGNTRELENEVRRMVALCPHSGVIDEALLSPALRDDAAASALGASVRATPTLSGLEEQVARLEARMIRDAIARTGGNRSKAASLLGLSRNGLAMKISRLGIDGGLRFRPDAPRALQEG